MSVMLYDYSLCLLNEFVICFAVVTFSTRGTISK